MENTLVADIQFFRGNNKELIVKSFSFCKLYDEDIVQHFIFKPPFDFYELNLSKRREATHVTLNFHHLEWDDGLVEYQEAIPIIRSCLSHGDEIFVKGLEKVTFLNSILPRKVCYNIENLDCPNFKVLKTNKILRAPCSPVSSLNVLAMKQWLRSLFENSLILCNDAIGAFSKHGFFSLSEKDLYFLPVNFLTYALNVDFLQTHSHKFAPHIVFNDHFLKKNIYSDRGYDTVDTSSC